MVERELDILFADEQIVVVNKPGGLLSVPGRGPEGRDCVVRRVRKMFPACQEQPAVHRLDQATSGLMVLALVAASHRHLSRQFAERRVEKKYTALLEGEVRELAGEIRLSFRLDPDNRPCQVHDPEQGKPGITRWQRLALAQGRTRVEFIPLTGRTHQLRLHAAHELGLGCPIVGDSLYGNGRRGDPMLLHAHVLAFDHPATSRRMEFHSPVPF